MKTGKFIGWYDEPPIIGMDRMHAAMSSVQPSGDSDADFVRLMLSHHQGAVDDAAADLRYGSIYSHHGCGDDEAS